MQRRGSQGARERVSTPSRQQCVSPPNTHSHPQPPLKLANPQRLKRTQVAYFFFLSFNFYLFMYPTGDPARDRGMCP